MVSSYLRGQINDRTDRRFLSLQPEPVFSCPLTKEVLERTYQHKQDAASRAVVRLWESWSNRVLIVQRGEFGGGFTYRIDVS